MTPFSRSHLTRLGLLLACLLSFTAPMYAQATKVISSPTLPSTCSDGAVYVKTGTAAGWYICQSGSWTGPYPTTGGGTVTSVGLSGSDFSFSGSPVTTSGTIGIALANSGVTAGSYTNTSVTFDAKGRATAASSGSAGAPANAQYWTGAADGTLSAEKDLSALSTGLVINTAGTPSAYAGSTCSAGQFVTSVSASGVASCSTPSGAGDVVGPSSSVASEIALFDGTTGKLLKRATNTGVLKASSGVIATATADSDYVTPPAMTGANVHTDETTNSTTYADLATTGPSVTRTMVGTTAVVWISVGCVYKTTTGNTAYVSVAVSGASTVAASDANAGNAIAPVANSCAALTAIIVLTGLTPGSNTFTLKYRVDGGTFHFLNRAIAVFAP